VTQPANDLSFAPKKQPKANCSRNAKSSLFFLKKEIFQAA
jgi:hypothetical protein